MEEHNFSELLSAIRGELHTEKLHRIAYATDASVYRELPLGIVYPKDVDDVRAIVRYCYTNEISLIPRAGGTSLAGQCVGSGLIVDVSKYMTRILRIDPVNKIAVVQPGVIRDELNHHLAPLGLMFGPNTSTANRATIGGMVGNNSCGSTSIVFGSTREHVHELKAILCDGSILEAHAISKTVWEEKANLDSIEGGIYRELLSMQNNESLLLEIANSYPDVGVKRRNSGYALDEVFSITQPQNQEINLCQLLCGSEGTLALTTEITLGLVDLPPPNETLIAVHFKSVLESLESVPLIMKQKPFACELMDKTILDCTKGQRLYEKDRYFLEGDPAAILLISFVSENAAAGRESANALISELEDNNYGYAYPIINKNVDRIWNLRKAGLGLLANLPGDDKAVACIEDTAVAIDILAEYIGEFNALMKTFGQEMVYYAHAGAGEIHLRPILNLKKAEDRDLFLEISQASARLVKKYKGSLSGEHGDGRVRAPFLEEFYGPVIFNAFKRVKSTWDPKGIFNPGKIVDAKDIREDLRYAEHHIEKLYETIFDFSETGGILKTAEKCNGSGDCRKLPLSGGTMCPSYMATRNEIDTTRARANTLREILTEPSSKNAWNSEILKEVMDLCISCKGCLSECPSNIDMSTMKAEFLYQYQSINGVPLRSKFFGYVNSLNGLAYYFYPLANRMLNNGRFQKWLKSKLNIHQKRSLPTIAKRSLRDHFSEIRANFSKHEKRQKIYLFVDEFTNYNDSDIGVFALKLLFALGYDVHIVDHAESGRAALSKGLLKHARRCAEHNVHVFKEIITNETPLVGIEPSAILSFVDEYPRLVRKQFVGDANELASNVFTIESFLYQQSQQGFINSSHFGELGVEIQVHGHCHQKALGDLNEVAWLLSLPKNSRVELIPSGCCGMAGSFGYEKEHYEVSMQIGELVLFPTLRKLADDVVICASGTSCRHQIKDGVGRKAKHSVEILYDLLNDDLKQ